MEYRYCPLTVLVDVDEVLQEEQETVRRYRNNGENFTLASSSKGSEDIETAHEREVEERWDSFETGQRMTQELKKYILCLLKKRPEERMILFSRDGISLIPSLQPLTTRIKLLQTVRAIIDSFNASDASDSVEKKKISKPCDITNDEEHIIQYMGGFILQKLKQKCKDPNECDRICSLMDSTTGACSNSLTGILENHNFGSLAVPIPQIVQLLSSLEQEFRANYTHEKIMSTCLSNFDIGTLPLAWQEDATFDILEKVCRLYLKIRCHQKARVLNSELANVSDQNISLRKVLKAKNK